METMTVLATKIRKVKLYTTMKPFQHVQKKVCYSSVSLVSKCHRTGLDSMPTRNHVVSPSGGFWGRPLAAKFFSISCSFQKHLIN